MSLRRPFFIGPFLMLFFQATGWAAVSAPVLQWGSTMVGTRGGSVYYLNDSVVGGNVLGARIAYGLYEQRADGTVVHSLATSPTAAAKSAVRVGDYVYFTGNEGGVYRTRVANTPTPWSSFAAVTISNGLALETMATDGKWIFGSTTAENDQIHAYSVDAATGALTLQWSTTGIAGRGCGLCWDESGYLYTVDGGGTSESTVGNTANMYAIAANSGATTDMGQITFNGRLYQTLREGNQIIVFDSFRGTDAPAGQMYVYDLASDTSLVQATPSAVYDPAEIDCIYGAAIDGNHLWLTSGGGKTYGYLISKPSASKTTGRSASAP